MYHEGGDKKADGDDEDGAANKEAGSGGKKSKNKIPSQAEFDQLMFMSPKEILGRQARGRKTDTAEEKEEAAASKTRKKMRQLVNKHSVRDPGFKTDIYTVRVAIRETHRNMPFDDFVKLVNFMLRGMK